MFACSYVYSHVWVSILFNLLLLNSANHILSDCTDQDSPSMFCTPWQLSVDRSANEQHNQCHTGPNTVFTPFVVALVEILWRSKTKAHNDRRFHLNPGHCPVSQCIKSAENAHYTQQEMHYSYLFHNNLACVTVYKHLRNVSAHSALNSTPYNTAFIIKYHSSTCWGFSFSVDGGSEPLKGTSKISACRTQT